jgi:putative endonuclease
MTKTYYVYILSSKKNGTLYIGITNDIKKRVHEHKSRVIKGFTQNYKIDRLVYYEEWDNPSAAIDREKQLKKYERHRKMELIEKNNYSWRDLSSEWL